MKILLTLLLLTLQLYSFEYVITQAELRENVLKEFPIKQSFFFSEFTFFRPAISIDKKSNLVFFECSIKNDAITLENGEIPTFRVFAHSDIRYNSGKLYLKDVKVTNIQNKHLSNATKENLLTVSELLLNTYFNKKPIFDAQDSDSSIKAASSMINNVIIHNSTIKVLF